MLENLEIDAGLAYLDNESIGHVRHVPLYSEHYRLITAADSPLRKGPKLPGRRSDVFPSAC
jgi:DNA-binding transcriptional LysR family regulator